MSQTQAKAFPRPAGVLPLLVKRLLFVIIVGGAMLWLVHRSFEGFERNLEPAGFARGMLHGALMPLALPNLLLGQDVTIYATNNRGRSYKLGYTVGVNSCGALFFGLCFWRLTRWRTHRKRQNFCAPATP